MSPVPLTLCALAELQGLSLELAGLLDLRGC